MAGPDGSLSSRTFYFGAQLRISSEDVQVVSQDNVYFYVHAVQLLAESDTFFGAMLVFPFGPPQHIMVAEQSSVFNIVLHAIYNLSCARYDPTDEDITSAVHALQKYGIPPARLLRPSTYLFQVILSRLPFRNLAATLSFYALSGQYDMRDLAVHCSQFLLPLRAFDISNEIATQMGVWYLRHLIFLRHGRARKLQALLSPLPHGHLPIPQCEPERQAALARAWRLTGAYFIWNGGAGQFFFFCYRLQRADSLVDHRPYCCCIGCALLAVGGWVDVRNVQSVAQKPPEERRGRMVSR